MAAMFFDESWLLVQSWYRFTKATFQPSNTEIGHGVCDNKNFKIFYADIDENKPRPLVAMFFDKSKWLEQSWYRITKGTFLQN